MFPKLPRNRSISWEINQAHSSAVGLERIESLRVLRGHLEGETETVGIEVGQLRQCKKQLWHHLTLHKRAVKEHLNGGGLKHLGTTTMVNKVDMSRMLATIYSNEIVAFDGVEQSLVLMVPSGKLHRGGSACNGRHLTGTATLSFLIYDLSFIGMSIQMTRQ
eukprot:1405191-Amphidinium_carterae.1